MRTTRPLTHLTPAANSSYADYCCELLGSLGHCTAKRMFGGFGLYVEGVMVGLVTSDTLYLKASKATKAKWQGTGGVSHIDGRICNHP